MGKKGDITAGMYTIVQCIPTSLNKTMYSEVQDRSCSSLHNSGNVADWHSAVMSYVLPIFILTAFRVLTRGRVVSQFEWRPIDLIYS